MSIHTGLDEFAPLSMARHDNGSLYICNGLNEAKKWNGISSAVVDVGVEAPTAAFTLTAGAAGNPNGDYRVFIRWLSDDGYVSNLKESATGTFAATSDQITVSSLPTSAPSRVAALQILRNTNGDELTLYVEQEILVASLTGSATLTMSDDDLANQPSVPLFDDDGNSLALRYDLPRSDKPIVVSHQGRLFMGGYAPYKRGHAEVTNGSPTITGVGTAWTSDMAGRYFHVFTHDPNYTISSVDTSAQTLTLSSNYAGSTSKYALYTIESESAARNTIYWSEASLPDAWPSRNGVQVGESGDEVTGLMVASTYLYVLQRRGIYRLTYNAVPTDGGVFLVALRGCINQRCWVREAGASYLLDSQGIYRFVQNEQIEPLTPPLDDMFWAESLGAELRVNWESAAYFHAITNRREKIIRWFISLGSAEFPRHAICFDFIKSQWWLEEYPFPVPASAVASETEDLTLFAGTAKRVWAMRGTLDGPNGNTGDTRVQCASASRLSVTISGTNAEGQATTLPTSGLLGYPITITRGRGKGQQRIITQIESYKIWIDQPWKNVPDTTSILQIGGISWKWRSRRLHWVRKGEGVSRNIAVHFAPTPRPGQFDIRRLPNHATNPNWYDSSSPLRDDELVRGRVVESYPDFEVFTNRGSGRVQSRATGIRDPHSDDLNTMSLELRGVTSPDELRIARIEVEGVEEYQQAGGKQ